MIRRALLFASVMLAAGTAGTARAQIVYYGTPVVASAVPLALPLPTAPAIPPAVIPSSGIYAPVAGAAPGVRSFYLVKRGGRLDTVARKMGVPVSKLIPLNPLLAPQTWLPPGTLVGLPVP